MAHSNMVMGNNPAFRSNGQYAPAPQYAQDPYAQPQGQGQYGQQGYAQPQYGQQQYGQPQYGQPQYDQSQAYSNEDLAAMYNRPAASGHDTGRMTWRDVMNAVTATLGIIIVLGGAVMLLPTALGLVMGQQGVMLGYAAGTLAAIVGAIGGLIAVLVNTFKKQPSALVTLAYAFFEGLFVGGISLIFEASYPGIVMQAVIGTLAVAGAILLLFRSGKLRTSPKLNKIFMVAMVAYLIFAVVNLVIVFAGGGSLRTGLLGIVIGAIAVLLASYSLVMDFEMIQNGVQNGAPRAFAWTAALGLAVTIVWMYTEILRLLAILRGND